MKIKSSILTAVIAAAAGLAPAHAAVVDYGAGDLVLSFYTKTSSSTGETVNVSVSLGDSATSFRGNLNGGSVLTGSSYWTGSGTSFTFNTNLDSTLDSAFGTDWFTRADLSFGIVANQNNSNFGSVVNGDPTRTVYVSSTSSASNWPGLSSTNVATAATNTTSFLNYFKTLSADAGQTLIATYADSNANSYENWQYLGNSGNRLADFNVFGTDVNGSVGTSPSINVYRVLERTTGASPSGTIGDGDLIGSFTLANDGSLTFNAVPEPSTYALLALAGGALLWIHARRRRA